MKGSKQSGNVFKTALHNVFFSGKFFFITIIFALFLTLIISVSIIINKKNAIHSLWYASVAIFGILLIALIYSLFKAFTFRDVVVVIGSASSGKTNYLFSMFRLYHERKHKGKSDPGHQELGIPPYEPEMFHIPKDTEVKIYREFYEKYFLKGEKLPSTTSLGSYNLIIDGLEVLFLDYPGEAIKEFVKYKRRAANEGKRKAKRELKKRLKKTKGLSKEVRKKNKVIYHIVFMLDKIFKKSLNLLFIIDSIAVMIEKKNDAHDYISTVLNFLKDYLDLNESQIDIMTRLAFVFAKADMRKVKRILVELTPTGAFEKYFSSIKNTLLPLFRHKAFFAASAYGDEGPDNNGAQKLNSVPWGLLQPFGFFKTGHVVTHSTSVESQRFLKRVERLEKLFLLLMSALYSFAIYITCIVLLPSFSLIFW